MSTGRPARVVGALGRLRPRDVAVVAGIGFLLVRLAFALLVPLGSGPDEPDHFVKAYGATRLDFGSREHVPPMHPKTDMERLNESLATAIDFGDQPTNPTWSCNAFHPELPATCLDLAAERPAGWATTPFGSFQPYLYVVIGLPTLVLDDPDHAMFGMRLVIVAWASLFTTWGLVVAARRFHERGLLASIVGWTPMVLYAESTLGTSGLEIAAAYVMFLAALDVLLEDGEATRGRFAMLVASTVTLSLSRPLSVVVVAVVAALALGVVGFRRSWDRARGLPRPLVLGALGAGAVAVLANLGWAAASPTPYTGDDLDLLGIVEHHWNRTLPGLWRGVIGQFEWLDTDLPLMVVVITWAAIVGVLTWSSPERDRAGSLRMWGLVAATIGFGFLADVTVFARVGGAVQGRHVLPLLQLWPLVALVPSGGTLDADRDGSRFTPLRAAAAVAAVATAWGWWVIAKREALGIGGGTNIFRRGAWWPIAGWPPTISLLAVGLVAAVAVPLAWGRAGAGGQAAAGHRVQTEGRAPVEDAQV